MESKKAVKIRQRMNTARAPRAPGCRRRLRESQETTLVERSVRLSVCLIVRSFNRESLMLLENTLEERWSVRSAEESFGKLSVGLVILPWAEWKLR